MACGKSLCRMITVMLRRAAACEPAEAPAAPVKPAVKQALPENVVAAEADERDVAQPAQRISGGKPACAGK